MTKSTGARKTGYDRYVDYRRLGVAIFAFALILALPVSESMLDVGVEVAVSEARAQDFLTVRLFGRAFPEAEQWQATTARILLENVSRGALGRDPALRRDAKWAEAAGIPVLPGQIEKYRAAVSEIEPDAFRDLMLEVRDLRSGLSLDSLSEAEMARAVGAAEDIRVIFAMLVFVVICFLTEAMPMPGVAFSIGLILVFSGIVTRTEVASLYWSDSVWFILGSLMFAAAFVKTGVDRRICLALFKYLAKPKLPVITGILILVISPLAAFISDHALAAMFLPIAVILYTNSLSRENPQDFELARMLMITVAMACNIGGFGAPSGGARNVIMMTYMEDMFGISIGYAEWILFGFPFVILMMIFLWVMVNLRFKPKIRSLGPALETLKKDIEAKGGWTGKQVVTLAIFVVMVFGWITEKGLLADLLGVRLGIGVIAVTGAMAFLLAGIVNWRDYQSKVDWGVVWLYGGAIILGSILSDSGTAYWLARSIVGIAEPLGLDSGPGLLAMGGGVTCFMTQLMSDGPAAACVGPVTLNMAAVAHPGTVMVPFMGLVTACASSMAYLLVIGTPPNAIVYSSGYLQMKDYFRVGLPCVLFALVLLIVMSMTWWLHLGFQGLPHP